MFEDEFYSVSPFDYMHVTLRQSLPIITETSKPCVFCSISYEGFYCLPSAILFVDVIGSIVRMKQMLGNETRRLRAKIALMLTNIL